MLQFYKSWQFYSSFEYLNLWPFKLEQIIGRLSQEISYPRNDLSKTQAPEI